MDGVPKDQQGPPSADAAKAEIWLSGHLGHLTEAEEAAFTAFKKLSAEKGVYQPATVDTKASHDDGTLVCVADCTDPLLPLIAYTSLGGISEHESLSRKTPSFNSRTQKYGGNKTTSMHCMRRSIFMTIRSPALL